MPLQLRGTFPVEGKANENPAEHLEMPQSRAIEALSGKPRPGWGLRICALVSPHGLQGPLVA